MSVGRTSVRGGRGSRSGVGMVRNMAGLFREYMALEHRRESDDGMSVADYQRWMDLKRTLNRHFQPELTKRNADRRDSIRVPVKLRLSFSSLGAIRQCLMTNVSRGGVFVSTATPLPLGTKIRLWIQVGDSGEEIEVEGEVASHNAGPGLLSDETGMGVRFVHLSEEQAKAVDNLYEHNLMRVIQDDPDDQAS
jgi:uncharacterized protein (TIGR02266 family)